MKLDPVAHPAVPAREPLVLSQFRLLHRAEDPEHHLVEWRAQSDISVRRLKDAERRQPRHGIPGARGDPEFLELVKWLRGNNRGQCSEQRNVDELTDAGPLTLMQSREGPDDGKQRTGHVADRDPAAYRRIAIGA